MPSVTSRRVRSSRLPVRGDRLSDGVLCCRDGRVVVPEAGVDLGKVFCHRSRITRLRRDRAGSSAFRGAPRSELIHRDPIRPRPPAGARDTADTWPARRPGPPRPRRRGSRGPSPGQRCAPTTAATNPRRSDRRERSPSPGLHVVEPAQLDGAFWLVVHCTDQPVIDDGEANRHQSHGSVDADRAQAGHARLPQRVSHPWLLHRTIIARPSPMQYQIRPPAPVARGWQGSVLIDGTSTRSLGTHGQKRRSEHSSRRGYAWFCAARSRTPTGTSAALALHR